ncbi:hypothetical protein TWF569_002443 [Orbilia oligospora]|nr:hypothetical protein TWF569_002443 [Orbilia oligospora]
MHCYPPPTNITTPHALCRCRRILNFHPNKISADSRLFLPTEEAFRERDGTSLASCLTNRAPGPSMHGPTGLKTKHGHGRSSELKVLDLNTQHAWAACC